jgi:hypothetical protein
MAPGLKKGLLDPMLRIVKRAKHPVTVQVQSAPVFVSELPETVSIPCQGSGKPWLVERRVHLTGLSPGDQSRTCRGLPRFHSAIEEPSGHTN